MSVNQSAVAISGACGRTKPVCIQLDRHIPRGPYGQPERLSTEALTLTT
jgi:hypothetical protein